VVPPLLLGKHRRRRTSHLRQVEVPIPSEVPSTDAIFLLLRRLRMPLLILVTVFTVAVVGLTLAPGVDADGKPNHLTVFEAFYVMSYTATTIGFGEVPNAFTTEQRLWITGSIYASVVAWAITVGMSIQLIQQDAFRNALAAQRFRRKVRRIDEPFHIIAGYGGAGARVAKALDTKRLRFVVIDRDTSRIDKIDTAQIDVEPPAVAGDAANAAILGLAGLGHRRCAGVLALTGDDLTNLGIVQAVHLLRPGLPVIAWSKDRDLAQGMRDFGASAVLNPYDRFGMYLTLGLRRPITLQLMFWLMAPLGTPLTDKSHGIPQGTWLVCAEGVFRDEVKRDLESAGYTVQLGDPECGVGDVAGIVGFVAGSDNDTINLALGAEVRRRAPEIYICLRQSRAAVAPLYEAFSPDLVFLATDLVARECFARISTPRMWAFLENIRTHSDEWSKELLDRLVERCGTGSPNGWRLVLNEREAPGVIRWLQHDPLTIRDLLRNPDDRETFTPVVVLALTRNGRLVPAPEESMELQPGDDLLVASPGRGYVAIRDTLFNEAVIQHLVTGDDVPTSWAWRRLTGHRTTTELARK
jgi:voltage-gated potassium channel